MPTINDLAQVTSVAGNDLIPLADVENGGVARSATVDTIKTYMNLNQLPINYKSSAPTTTDINDGYAQVWKNTTSGVVSLWVNDTGAMKSVALS